MLQTTASLNFWNTEFKWWTVSFSFS